MESTFDSCFQLAVTQNQIDNDLYRLYNVKKGLRNEDGTGVRIGLTRIADVVGYEYKDGVKTTCEGKLIYRGYEIRSLVENKAHMGFEETCFLLLFGWLPSAEQLKRFHELLTSAYELPHRFMEANILPTHSSHLMNRLQQMVLALFDYDQDPEDTSPQNTLRQGIELLARMPALITSLFQVKQHHYDRQSLTIHYPQEELSIAENILYLLREDHRYTPAEADTLDVLLMLHADHGGGNNSTFTNVVVASTGSDFFSTISASIGSLKGPRHGGANQRVVEMMADMQKEIGLEPSDEQLREILMRLLNRDFYDHAGLIYGIGHAIYTLSDPRAEIIRSYCERLAKEKGREKEYTFYVRFEKMAIQIIKEVKGIDACANVDLYSGFAYTMLNIPQELYTPLFVCSRICGWLAHNIENKLYDGRIMRPATRYVGELHDYVNMEERKDEDCYRI